MSNKSMVMTSVPLTQGGQQLVVMDAQKSVLACYHTNVNGEIELKSIRNITWDLQMQAFNDKSELKPDDIQALINKR